MNAPGETVYAPATPAGGAIAILRITGGGAKAALAACFNRKDWPPQLLQYGRITADGRLADEAMGVYFAAPHSYTGEDMAEIHCHGAPPIIRRIEELLRQAGLRQAQPGEFTRRSFLNGKMDLSRAEAVMDVIQSDADAAAKAALDQLSGALGRRIRAAQSALVDAVARLHAGLDYPEEDWEEDIAVAAAKEVRAVQSGVCALLATAAQGRLLREGFHVVLAGRPNAGKSSLLNALLGDDRAIVTGEAGTTRDTIEEKLNLGGLPVRLTDTAGLRAAAGEAEAMGVQRARAAIDRADLLLLLFDGAAPLTREDYDVLALADGRPVLGVITKADLPQLPEVCATVRSKTNAVTLSVLEPDGAEPLKQAILHFYESLGPKGAALLVTNARHAGLLCEARDALCSALDALSRADLDCASIDLAEALRALGGITGDTVDEAVIDAIFSRFCLGK